MRLLFCNVGWMEKYQGLHSGDEIRSKAAWIKEHGRGGEICNFSPVEGILYGYVRPSYPGDSINLERLGDQSSDASISGVTVVWTAPRRGMGSVVVGWYKNAKVFRNYQRFAKVPNIHRKNGLEGYWIKAPEVDAVLLPIDSRTISVPRSVPGGLGPSNVWFADTPQRIKLISPVLTLIQTGKVTVRKPRRHGRGRVASDRILKVEKTAVAICRRYFEGLDYSVDSVEKDNRGWDLEAKKEKLILRIEVKGLSGRECFIELTPNEYKAFAEKSNHYRLAVVTNCLLKPKMAICRFSEEENDWVVEDRNNAALKIKIRESASITF